MPANLENSAMTTGLERSVFISIPKKDNAKECSNYGTIVLYYCGQESLRRNGIALIVNERV